MVFQLGSSSGKFKSILYRMLSISKFAGLPNRQCEDSIQVMSGWLYYWILLVSGRSTRSTGVYPVGIFAGTIWIPKPGNNNDSEKEFCCGLGSTSAHVLRLYLGSSWHWTWPFECPWNWTGGEWATMLPIHMFEKLSWIQVSCVFSLGLNWSCHGSWCSTQQKYEQIICTQCVIRRPARNTTRHYLMQA